MENLNRLSQEFVVVLVNEIRVEFWEIVGLCRLTVIFRGIDAELADVACSGSGCPSLSFVQRYEPDLRRSVLPHSLGGKQQSRAGQVAKSSDGQYGSEHNCPSPGVQKFTGRVTAPRRSPAAAYLSFCFSTCSAHSCGATRGPEYMRSFQSASVIGPHTMHPKVQGEPTGISLQHDPYFCLACSVLLLEAVLRNVRKGRWSRVSPSKRVGVGTGESGGWRGCAAMH